jgi:ABC1 family protein
MKGAAMKVGQMLSVVEVGLVPPEFREDFQRSLAKLRDAAPTVKFDQMRKVIEKDLDGRISELFAEFDREPIAAASIGQVYRAALPSGSAVAIKVHYPGVATAVRADLKNLALVMRLVKQVFPGVDVDALADEIRSRVGEELDYALEALQEDALPALAGRSPARPPHRSLDARDSRPAARDGELAPDRPRVDVRRPARDRARAAGSAGHLSSPPASTRGTYRPYVGLKRVLVVRPAENRRRAASKRSSDSVPSAAAGVRQPARSGVRPSSARSRPASPSIRAVAR